MKGRISQPRCIPHGAEHNDIKLCWINWNPTGSMLETSSHTVWKKYATLQLDQFLIRVCPSENLFWEQQLCLVAAKNTNVHLRELCGAEI